MGFEEPTPIQAQAIPVLIAGRDVIAQALTGTGKTAAFGVPLIERIDPTELRPQAIVLTPTRELAVQVTDQLCKIGHERRVTVLPIYGGQPIGRQLHSLNRGVHAIVATPGRLLDHMRRGSVDLAGVRTLILDEADQMLEMGFIEDVQYVLEHLPADRVTALFSATMPKPIVDLAQAHLREPEMIRLAKPQALTVPDIDQVFYLVPFPRKLDALCRVLDVRQPERAVVFCATKRMVDEVVEGLGARGYQSEALHGDISQMMRERVLRAFRSGKTEVLVATDVAARGLDVPEVTHVINFDIPPDPEYYVHRIGRTGRYGRRGEAITFVNPREMRILKLIERATGAHIRREEVPTAAEAGEREAEILGARLTAALSSGGWGRFRPLIEELLLEDHDPVDLAAAALHLVATGAVGTRRVTTAPPAAAQAPTPPPAALVTASPVRAASPATPETPADVTAPPVHAAVPGRAAMPGRETAPAGPFRPAAPTPARPAAQRSDRAEPATPRRAPFREQQDGPPWVRRDRRADGPMPFSPGGPKRGRHAFGPDALDDDRGAAPANDRRPAPARDTDQAATGTPPRKPRRPALLGKPGGKPSFKGGGKAGTRAPKWAAAAPARPPRPKRPR